MTYVVTAPAVRAVVATEALFIERGALLPAGVSDADVKRWLGKGLIEALPEVAEVEPVAEDVKVGAPAKPSSK